MPKQTEADRHQANARRHINGAIADLGAILIDGCEGSGDEHMGRSRRLALTSIMASLMKIREMLVERIDERDRE